MFGLKTGRLLLNCKVLVCEREATPDGYRREHFLVKVDETLLTFRI